MTMRVSRSAGTPSLASGGRKQTCVNTKGALTGSNPTSKNVCSLSVLQSLSDEVSRESRFDSWTGHEAQVLLPAPCFDGTRPRKEMGMDLIQIIEIFSRAAYEAYHSGQCLPMWMP